MNIYQKLIEVRKSCPYLKKDNKGFQFSYVSSSQTLGVLRDEMDKQGLLLIPSIVGEKTVETKTKKGDTQWLVEIEMQFTWVNAEKPEEKITVQWFGQGIDAGEKGVGKALTYAEKYFMLKFFNIPTDNDDPDAFQRKKEQSKPAKPVKPVIFPKISEEQHRQIEAIIGKNNWIREDLKGICVQKYGVNHFPELDSEMFRDFIAMLTAWENQAKNIKS